MLTLLTLMLSTPLSVGLSLICSQNSHFLDHVISSPLPNLSRWTPPMAHLLKGQSPKCWFFWWTLTPALGVLWQPHKTGRYPGSPELSPWSPPLKPIFRFWHTTDSFDDPYWLEFDTCLCQFMQPTATSPITTNLLRVVQTKLNLGSFLHISLLVHWVIEIKVVTHELQNWALRHQVLLNPFAIFSSGRQKAGTHLRILLKCELHRQTSLDQVNFILLIHPDGVACS